MAAIYAHVLMGLFVLRQGAEAIERAVAYAGGQIKMRAQLIVDEPAVKTAQY